MDFILEPDPDSPRPVQKTLEQNIVEAVQRLAAALDVLPPEAKVTLREHVYMLERARWN